MMDVNNLCNHKIYRFNNLKIVLFSLTYFYYQCKIKPVEESVMDNINLAIEKEQKQLKLWKTLKLVSIGVLVLSILAYILTIILTIMNLLAQDLSGFTEETLQLYIMQQVMIPIFISSIFMPFGLAGIIVFAIFTKKKKQNIKNLKDSTMNTI